MAGGFKHGSFMITTNTDATYTDADGVTVLRGVGDALVALGVGWTRITGDEPTAWEPKSGVVHYYDIYQGADGRYLWLAYSRRGSYSSTVSHYPVPVAHVNGYGSKDYGIRDLMAAISLDPFNTETTPDDAAFWPASSTRAAGMALASSTSQNADTTLYASPQRNTSWTYHAISDGRTASFWLTNPGVYGAGKLRGFIMGPLIGTPAHTAEDSTPQCRMGVFSFAPDSASSDAGSSYINSESNYVTKTENSTSCPQILSFCAADGEQKIGGFSAYDWWYGASTTCICAEVCNPDVAQTGRYAAMWVARSAADLQQNGIVNGDGFKGYIDTDIMRVVRRNFYTKGQLFDGGNFVYIGGGIAIGWDPSNTGSLF